LSLVFIKKLDTMNETKKEIVLIFISDIINNVTDINEFILHQISVEFRLNFFYYIYGLL
jgi:hypothetical protein